jgi:hypothetical protein
MTDAFATIEELGRALRQREVTSLELTRFYLQRLEKHGPGLGALVTLMRTQAEAEARERDAEIAAESGAARCTAFPTARRTWWRRAASRRHGAPNRTAVRSSTTTPR